jgi:hypothetical protein
MADYTIKASSDLSPFAVVLSAAAGPIDLSSAVSVTAKIKPYATRDASTSLTMAKDADQVNNRGRCSATWQIVEPGLYDVEFLIVWPGNVDQRVPNSGYMLVSVERAL